MAGIFDFIKKKTNDATGDADSQSQASNVHQNSSYVADPNSPDQKITDQPAVQQSSYNGIGAPSTGQAYNGIGSPPSGQSFNGITSPITPSPTQSAQPPVQPVQPSQTQSLPRLNKPVSAQTTPQPQQSTQDQEDKQKLDNIAPEEKPVDENTKKETDQQVGIPNPKPDQKVEKASDEIDNKKEPSKEATLDVMTHLTNRSNKVFMDASNKAKEVQNSVVDSEHLLSALIKDGEIYKLLVDLKVQPQLVEQELVKTYKKESFQGQPQLSPRVKQITQNSLIIARKLGYEFISPEHLFLALYYEGEGVGARVLTQLGLQKEELNKKITGKKEGVSADPSEKDAKSKKPKQKSALEKYSIDLTAKAANGELDPVVERSDVIERVVHILSRRIKNNPALIGEPGVGKTAVVEGLAQRIVDQSVPEGLLNKKILQLDLSSVVAGASHRGEFEERMKDVVDELKASKGQIIMFIDEMHTMMGAGAGDGAIDASNFIKPALARGEVQFVGATTITEYRKYIEKDAALERRFQSVLVPEPSPEAAIKMLKATRDKYEAFHKVKIPDESIELAVQLSKRYVGDRFLPDKAFDLMDEAAAAVRLPLISLPEEIKSLQGRIAQLQQEAQQFEQSGEKVRARIARSKAQEVEAKLHEKEDEYSMKKAQTTTQVTNEIIKDIIAKRTGIPVSKISTSEGDKLANMEDIIHKRMIDQERAVAAVSQAIRRGRSGLKSPKRPIGSFVFLGPTGVGKTELAKTVTEVLFDDEDAIIRFDMTEYMERHEVAKLLGPPPGYVGFEEGGKLTEAVRRKPYSLVLFDEIEKAHPDIFNILLQILDDGRLTDNKGRTISFKNTVLVCTSNIGTKMIQDELIKSGKTEVAEPPMLSTYTFSPRGREILTIGKKYFERGGDSQPATLNPDNQKNQSQQNMQVNGGKMAKPSEKQKSWDEHELKEYFAGQKVDTESMKPKKQEEIEGLEKDPNTQDRKTEDHARDYTQEAMQNVSFPTFGYDTHAISPQGREIVSKGNTLFMRNATTDKVWQLTNLIDYFEENIVINAMPDAPDEQLPTIRLRTHAFTPENYEIVTFKDRFWRRKEGNKDWETGLLKEYFIDNQEKKTTLPVTHWDIHAFSPTGREVIIVGDKIWYRDNKEQPWKSQSLSEYFGSEFPLEKELSQKQTTEEETDLKKYDLIKEKVMNELLKFFRPELVNRFDEVIVFEPLKFIHMLEIVKLQLKGVQELLEEQEIGFETTDEANRRIVREGFDPIYGARPLRRAIQKLVENPISEMIISQKVKAGDTILVDFDGEELTFNIEKNTQKSAKNNHHQLDPQAYVGLAQFCATNAQARVFTAMNATPVCSRNWQEKVDKSNKEKRQSAETKQDKVSAQQDRIPNQINVNSIKQEDKAPNQQQKIVAVENKAQSTLPDPNAGQQEQNVAQQNSQPQANQINQTSYQQSEDKEEMIGNRPVVTA